MAGNPNAYPVEYYNERTGQFEGMIPELLRRFSRQTSYDMRYYEPSSKDHREQWADQTQVDLISARIETDSFQHVDGQEIVLLQTRMNGEAVTYGLYVTRVAPSTLADELRSFLSQTNQEVKTGLLIQSATQNDSSHLRILSGVACVLGIVAFVLAIVSVVMTRRYRRRMKELEWNKERDEVTGIGNIDYLRRCHRSLINDQNRVLYSMLYFHVDIDRLDQAGGREQTNKFLRNMAISLQDQTSNSDILARVSDSGFALFRVSVEENMIVGLLQSVLERLQAHSGGMTVEQAFAVGVYNLGRGDLDLNEIIAYARQGAQSAYQAGEKYRICSPELLQSMMEDLRLQKDFDRALRDQEFKLYIQFYVDAVSNRIVGGEALSRWDHPTLGLLEPEKFIPLMEREGQIVQLDYYYLQKTCDFLKLISSCGIDDFFMSCNFSRETFAADDFLERCKGIVRQYDFSKQRLILELTESTVSRNPTLVSRNIRALKELGVQVALDDFGGEGTSFLDIQTYSLDALKLHKNMVKYITTDKGKAILRSLIQICHDLGLTAMAEGVETEEQIQTLRSLSCDVVQGFQFYYPLPDWEANKKILEQRDATVVQEDRFDHPIPDQEVKKDTPEQRDANNGGPQKNLSKSSLFDKILSRLKNGGIR